MIKRMVTKKKRKWEREKKGKEERKRRKTFLRKGGLTRLNLMVAHRDCTRVQEFWEGEGEHTMLRAVL